MDVLDFPLGPEDPGARDDGGASLRRSAGSCGSAELDALLSAPPRRRRSSCSTMDYLDLANWGSLETPTALDDAELRLSEVSAFSRSAFRPDDAEMRLSGGSAFSRESDFSRRSRGRGPGVRAAPLSASMPPRVQLQAVDFDPPPPLAPPPSLPLHRGRPAPRVPADVGLSSSRMTEPPVAAPLPSPEERQWSHQLDRLAASMRRTGESRRCVILQRELLFTPEQRMQLDATKEALRRSTQQQCLRLQQQRWLCSAASTPSRRGRAKGRGRGEGRGETALPPSPWPTLPPLPLPPGGLCRHHGRCLSQSR